MNKHVVTDLAWGVGIVAVALAASWARNRGLMDSDTVMRLVIGLTGLMIASFGNRLPKALVQGPWAPKARRVAGWSLVLSGLAYAGLWAFASIPVAVAGGCAVVLTGIAVSIGYAFVARSSAQPSPGS